MTPTQPMLNNPDLFPEREVIWAALGDDCYPVFEELMNVFSRPDAGMTITWKYYPDGKSWLCRIMYKKKTVCWLSVWEHYFKISFYFTEKHRSAVAGLGISCKIRDAFEQVSPVGKLVPMILEINSKEHINDVLKIIEFRKSTR